MTNTVDYEALEKTNGSHAIDPKEARAAVEREREERVEACSNALAGVLEEYQCNLDVSVVLSQGQVTPQISVIPKN